MACRLPAAASPEQLWELLAAGGTTTDDATRALDALSEFDAEFFEISPREAGLMDPQQRLLLEVAYEAAQDAGWTMSGLAGSDTGVYIGQTFTNYWDLQAATPERLSFHSLLGTLRGALSGRLAHALDLRGPAISVDTACSSSLTALHLAVQSLRTGECPMALVGGVHLVLTPHESIAYAQADMLSERGVCAFGDAGADGFARADGVVVVALKPLDAAVTDGDRVRAVILATAVNNDGRSTSAMAAPSLEGQAAVLRRAYRLAGVEPSDVSYVEAHGTGTPAGDPVELAALSQVLGAGRCQENPLLVGSVKSNIGHCEAAAGLAGLVKTVLCLENRRVPGNPRLVSPRPDMDWLTMRVPTVSTALSRSGRLVAGVSATGLSGTNAHAVLAAGEPVPSARPDGGAHLLAISARTPAGLRDASAAWAMRLTANRDALRDLAFTAAVRRDHFAHRLACVGTDPAELAARLTAWAAGDDLAAPAAHASATPLRPVFVFPGQGGQWPGMGRSLLSDEPVFRTTVEECDRAVRQEAGWSVLAVLERAEPLSRSDVVQPVLWAVQTGLAALWRSWEVEPVAVIGHSMGEVAAACTAGALTVRDAARIICRRSALAARATGGGAMASVSLDATTTAEFLARHGRGVCVAAVNGPSATVVSGDADAVRAVVGELERQGVQASLVRVDFASHSHRMDPILPELETALTGLSPRDCRIAIRSTVTGQRVRGATLDAAYWAANLRQPVNFAGAVAAEQAEEPDAVFVEISPHPVLLAPLRETLSTGIAVASTRRDQPERAALLTSLAELYLAGRPAPAAPVHGPGARFVPAPTYPWRRAPYWFDESAGASPVEKPARTSSPVPSLAFVRVPAGPVDGPVDSEDLVRRHVAAVLGTQPGAVDPHTPLRRFGLDSVLAVELRTRLAPHTGTELPVPVILAGSVAELAGQLGAVAEGA